jgi:hypothetical protein
LRVWQAIERSGIHLYGLLVSGFGWQSEAKITSSANNRYFITVDAETEVIVEGIQVISRIRDEIERQENMRIPIIWFVRFQRSWTDSVENDSPQYFEGRVTKGFDGFQLAKSQLQELCQRGDEIGWHYHAYNYVSRDDLSHAAKMQVLKADLVSCANAIKERHPYFRISAVRFGWFFVPDYNIFDTLKEIGIRADASIRPQNIGPVRSYAVNYLPPLTSSVRRSNGIWLFPFSRTHVMHDWNVVPHNFEWDSLDDQGAVRNRSEFKKLLLETAVKLKKKNGAFDTYQGFLEKESK